jgi:hypothetical protein
MAMLKARDKHWQFQAQIEERKERAGEVRFCWPFLKLVTHENTQAE